MAEEQLTINYDQPLPPSEQQTPTSQPKPQPVVCLGITFENDEQRREHFRNELRSLLPELRKMEGFPIGTDDDIINLSDPPYYTACPNPWLNDFVAQWESEKSLLQQQGKRKADFEVNEPYASDISEGKNNPVYTAHTYHTKVPHPAIMRYILHYTQPGDIVLDGFAGTGMTGVAAAACSNANDDTARRINAEWMQNFGCKPNWGARHAVIGDLSPYATNIAYFYNTPVNILKLQSEANRIKKEMLDECAWMYTTTDSHGKPNGRISFVVWSDIFVCPACGQEYVFWNQAVDHQNKCMHDEFYCPHCNALQSKKTAKPALETYYDEALRQPMKRVKQVPVIVVGKSPSEKIQRAPNQYDLDVLKKINDEKITEFFPIDALPEGYNTEQPKRTRQIYYVYQFFTKRNLIALAKLYRKIEASPMAHALRFMFTAMINRSTNMNRVHINYYFNGGGGWNAGYLKGTLYVPNAPTETSVLEQIGDKLSAMTKASENLAKVRPNIQYVGSADSLNINNDSIDYIFTDPPFGANINYSELNSLPEPWLRVVTNNTHEAIENTAQGKDSAFYRDTMTHCFKEYFRVLKPGKWLTVEFSNTSAAVWNSIQNALQNVGFVIASVSALDKKQGSFKAVTTTTAVKQDLVITCYKPSKDLAEKIVGASERKETVWDFVQEHLEHLSVHIVKDSKTTTVVERSPKILYDRLISYYIQNGFVLPIDAAEFQQGLRERFVERDGMFFTAVQAAEYEEKRRATEGMVPMGIVVDSEAEGIAWLKNQLKTPQTYQQIQPQWMQAINGIRKGDILPELKTILEENFIETAEGKWRLPNSQDDADMDALRRKALMREFNLYRDQALRPKSKLREVRVEAIREGLSQCYKAKDFATIVAVCNKIPENLLNEDPQILMFYNMAQNKI